MIRLVDVDKYFNRFKKNKIHVINHTSLELEHTGLVALLGPSGSGKTTLLNVMGGLDKVRCGKIYVNGCKITHRSQNRIDKIRTLNIGYIFQDYKLIENMTVYDNVALVLKMIGIKDKKEIDKRVCYVLDKVGMLRYKRRPANMLSGGERQRVGIARAIVKNPGIIIADEPTGNLDSKNTIEIMNIIKAISKDKLVILVTHEVNLAKFYAARIIELEDGKIIKDYPNDNENDLDYEMANTLYLKDYQKHLNYDDIHVFSNNSSKVKLNVVIVDDNIYIKSLDHRKIEVIDETSSIEMIDAHHKNLSKNEIDSYEFDYDKVINNPKKIRYSSIFNPISFITNGFMKILDYPLLKKILLIGFFLSGIFVQYATSSILTSVTIRDDQFVTINPTYLIIEAKKVKIDDYLKYQELLQIDYMIPTDSQISFRVKNNDFYQTSKQGVKMTASLSSVSLLDSSKLVYGRVPSNDHEVVIDQMILKKTIQNVSYATMVGLSEVQNFLDKQLEISSLDPYTIVGITNQNSPSLYVSNNQMISMLYHSQGADDEESSYMPLQYIQQEENYLDFDDYQLYLDKIVLKEGRMPENDYETIVNISNKEHLKLSKECDKKIHNRKLVVVGYYESKDSINTYFVNSNMVLYRLIESSSNMALYSSDKDNTLKLGRDLNLNIKDSYTSSLEKYKKEQRDSIKSSLISAGIILTISLIEILLMIRSSFLSRIKEVGIYRAIGVKKKDIYIMFCGEIIAITLIASTPGILLCAYILKTLTHISFLEDAFIINPFIVCFSILLVLFFNLLIGLIPVFHTIRKRPAEILSRTDI